MSTDLPRCLSQLVAQLAPADGASECELLGAKQTQR
jgi:hypothetical protein